MVIASFLGFFGILYSDSQDTDWDAERDRGMTCQQVSTAGIELRTLLLSSMFLNQ